MTAPTTIFDLPDRGRFLIEANAGSGKTWQMATLFVWLVALRGAKPEDIVVATYTKAAAEELRTRIIERMEECAKALSALPHAPSPDDEQQLAHTLNLPRAACHQLINHRAAAQSAMDNALAQIERWRIFTLHAYFYQLLKWHALSAHLPIEATLIEEGEEKHLRHRKIAALWRERYSQSDSWRDEFLEKSILGATKTPALAFFNQLNQAHPYWWLDDFLDRYPTPENLAKALKDFFSFDGLHLDYPPEPDWQSLLALEGTARTLKSSLINEREDLLAALNKMGLSGTHYRANTLKNAFEAVHEGLSDGLSHQAWPKERREESEKIFPDILRARRIKLAQKQDWQAPERLKELADFLPSWWMALDGFHAWFSAQEKATLAGLVHHRMNDHLLRMGMLTFSSVIDKAYHAFVLNERAEQWRQNTRESFWLIDEFQDTDSRQWAILHALQSTPIVRGEHTLPERWLVAVGDPKQSIYTFRGADVNAYLRARAMMSAEPLILPTNFRAQPLAVTAINTLFTPPHNATISGAFAHQGIVYHPSESRINAPLMSADSQAPYRMVMLDENNKANANDTSDANERAVDHALNAYQQWRTHHPSIKAAILVNKNEQGLMVTNMASARGLVVHFDSSHFRAEPLLLLWWRLLSTLRVAPSRSSLAGLMLTPWVASLTVSEWMVWRQAPSTNDWAQALPDLYEKINRYRAIWWGEGGNDSSPINASDRLLPKGLLALWQSLVADGLLMRLQQEGYDARDTSALFRIAQALIEHSSEPSEQLQAINAWLDEPWQSAIAPTPAPMINEGGLTVSTLHKAKGLQWDVVYCPFIERTSTRSAQKVSPLYYRDGHWHLSLIAPDPESAEHQDIVLQSRQEAIRRFYVLLTRATTQCTIYLRSTPLKPPSDARSIQSLREDNHHLIAPLHDLLIQTPTHQSGGWQLMHETDLLPMPLWVPNPKNAPTPQEGLNHRPVHDSVNTSFLLPHPYIRRFIRLQNASFTAWQKMRQASKSINLLFPRLIDRPNEPEGGSDEWSPDQSEDSAIIPLSTWGGRSAGIAIHALLAQVIDQRSLFWQEQKSAPKAAHIKSWIDNALSQDFASLPTPEQTLLRYWAYLALTAPIASWLSSTQPPSPNKTINPSPQPPHPPLSAPFCPEQECAEWPFSLHWNTPSSQSRQGNGMWQSALAALGYPVLPLSPQGWLRGAMDWVWVHEGRYYIVDFKSNRLPDYHTNTIRQAVDDSGYRLQAALYLCVLHRALKNALPEYSPASHLGGVAFWFLRALHNSDTAHESFYLIHAHDLPFLLIDKVFSHAHDDAQP